MSSERAPICVIVEFEDVKLGGKRFFSEASGLSERCVPIFHFEAQAESDRNVKRQQFPLTLAWALTHWKAQGMTLKRVRVSLTPTTAKQVGVGFVTVTRVGHPWQLMFETDLPPYQAFQEAVYGEEFRARQRFKLQLRAMAGDTTRRYAQKGVIYEKEQ